MDAESIKHIAHLARLRVSDKELARFASELSDILRYVDQLNELDTSDVPPTAHPLPLSNVLRDDEPRSTLAPDAALSNAPRRRDDFFQVPKVLDQESG